jgi:hypothetical protein
MPAERASRPGGHGVHIGIRGRLYTIIAGFSTLPNFALRMVFSENR